MPVRDRRISITVSLPAQLEHLIWQLAEKNNASRSQTITRLLVLALDTLKEGEAQRRRMSRSRLVADLTKPALAAQTAQGEHLEEKARGGDG
jgi:metal-responsive CopG/Arc/MetJ family transcriptional regulator